MLYRDLFDISLIWFMLIMAFEDLKMRSVEGIYLYPFSFLSLFGGLTTLNFLNVFAGFLISFFILGMIYLFAYLIAKERPMGEGDIIILLCLGVYLGKRFLFFFLNLGFISLFFILIYFVFGLKKRVSKEIPFVPFIFLSFILDKLSFLKLNFW